MKKNDYICLFLSIVINIGIVFALTVFSTDEMVETDEIKIGLVAVESDASTRFKGEKNVDAKKQNLDADSIEKKEKKTEKPEKPTEKKVEEIKTERTVEKITEKPEKKEAEKPKEKTPEKPKATEEVNKNVLPAEYYVAAPPTHDIPANAEGNPNNRFGYAATANVQVFGQTSTRAEAPQVQSQASQEPSQAPQTTVANAEGNPNNRFGFAGNYEGGKDFKNIGTFSNGN